MRLALLAAALLLAACSGEVVGPPEGCVYSPADAGGVGCEDPAALPYHCPEAETGDHDGCHCNTNKWCCCTF